MNTDFIEEKQKHFQNFLKECGEFLGKNKIFLIYGLIWCIISFGFELFQYTGSIDDEVFETRPGPAYFWATQGRFTSAYFLGLFFGNLCVPFFSLFFSQLCMFVAYYLAFIGRSEVKGALHYIAMPLFLSAPILFYVYVFNCLTPIIGIGFLFSVVAVILLEKRNIISVLAGLLVGGVAIGCYQVFMSVIIILLLFRLIRKLETAASFLYFIREGVFYFLFAVGCFCSYSGIFKLIIHFTNRKSSSYVAGLLDLTPDSWDMFIRNSKRILERIWQIYSGSDQIYTEKITFLLPLTVLLVILFFYVNVWKSKLQLWKCFFFFFCFLVIIFLPFIFYFIGIGIPVLYIRSTIAVVLIVPFLFIEVWKKIHANIHFLLGIVAGICLLQFLYVNSKLSYICYLREKHDDAIVQHIRDQIFPIAKKWPKEKIYFYVHGRYDNPGIPDQFISGKTNEIIGSSCFGYEDSSRFAALFRKKLYPNVASITPKMYPLIENEVHKMPNYPAVGSVKLVNGIAVVKFSDSRRKGAAEAFLRYAKIKNSFTGKKYADDFYLIRIDKQRLPKTIWHGDRNTLKANAGTQIRFFDNSHFESIGIGRDPQLNFIRLPQTKSKEICLQIQCTSKKDDILQIYFWTVNPEKTNKKEIGYCHIRVWRGVNDVAIVFPSDILKNGLLRLDPGFKGSHIIFENISLHEYQKEKGVQNAEKN